MDQAQIPLHGICGCCFTQIGVTYVQIADTTELYIAIACFVFISDNVTTTLASFYPSDKVFKWAVDPNSIWEGECLNGL